jgi:hypothetical protein
VEVAELSRWRLKQSFDMLSNLMPRDGSELQQLVVSQQRLVQQLVRELVLLLALPLCQLLPLTPDLFRCC